VIGNPPTSPIRRLFDIRLFIENASSTVLTGIILVAPTEKAKAAVVKALNTSITMTHSSNTVKEKQLKGGSRNSERNTRIFQPQFSEMRHFVPNHLKHSFGRGKENESRNFVLLNLIAFMIHVILAYVNLVKLDAESLKRH
jgi:hypothetical protein